MRCLSNALQSGSTFFVVLEEFGHTAEVVLVTKHLSALAAHLLDSACVRCTQPFGDVERKLFHFCCRAQRAALAQDGKATLDAVEAFEDLVDGNNSLLLKLSQRRSRPAGDDRCRTGLLGDSRGR